MTTNTPIPHLNLPALAGCLLPLFGAVRDADASRPPNILFIAIDDLRNDLGALGVPHARTPHLDALADRGRLFSHHYIQVPSCGPSRRALLSGMHPTHAGHLPNNAISATHPEWGAQSLPAWFRRHGYKTLALGKITHHPGGRTGRDWATGPEELPGAWDRSWVPETPWETPLAMMHGYANGQQRVRGSSPPFEAYDGPDSAYPDAWIADEAIRVLEDLVSEEQPWFFGVGFFKPHLPFAAPQRWFDLHDPGNIPAPPNSGRPEGRSSWHGSGEMMGNYGHASRDPRQEEDYARELRHAYAAATSYVDAQVGRLMEQFDALGLGEQTIVIVWSDHGFCLGEHGIWGKHAPYDEALRAPLIVAYPEIPYPGRHSAAVVETVDIFPTLTDLAGLPTPDGLHGISLRAHLKDPSTATLRPALSWSRRQVTVRTDDWRLIVHPMEEATEFYELFDFRRDPVHGERVDPEDHGETVSALRAHLSDDMFLH